eukprot:scaffold110787_cov59-Phaeocystis_antarctica.AAC.1
MTYLIRIGLEVKLGQAWAEVIPYNGVEGCGCVARAFVFEGAILYSGLRPSRPLSSASTCSALRIALSARRSGLASAPPMSSAWTTAEVAEKWRGGPSSISKRPRRQSALRMAWPHSGQACWMGVQPSSSVLSARVGSASNTLRRKSAAYCSSASRCSVPGLSRSRCSISSFGLARRNALVASRSSRNHLGGDLRESQPSRLSNVSAPSPPTSAGSIVRAVRERSSEVSACSLPTLAGSVVRAMLARLSEVSARSPPTSAGSIVRAVWERLSEVSARSPPTSAGSVVRALLCERLSE